MNTKTTFKLSSLAAATILFSACSSTPDNISQIDATMTEYESMKHDPSYQQLVPAALHEAGESVDRLSKLVEDNADQEKLDHQLYLTERELDTVQALYDARAAEQKVADADSRRSDLLLEKKDRQLAETRREAENAKLAAAAFAQQSQAAQQQLQTMRDRASELQDELETIKAEETEKGLVLTLSNILFPLNKATMKPGADATINKVADFLNEYPGREITIEGFTDSTGSDDYNQKLSERRAAAVKTALVNEGVAPNRITTQGMGEARPIASNDSAAGRQQNRRVEILISKNQDMALSSR